MSDRAWIDGDLHEDDTFAELSTDAKYVALWMRTNRRCGMAGIYRITERVMLSEMSGDMSPERLRNALDELRRANLGVYLQGVVYVPGHVATVRAKGGNHAKNIAQAVRNIDPGHGLRHRFLQDWGEYRFVSEKEVAEKGSADLPELLAPLCRESFGGTVSEPFDNGPGKARLGKAGLGADGRGKVRSGNSEVSGSSYVEGAE